MNWKLASVALVAILMTGCSHMGKDGKDGSIGACDIRHENGNRVYFGFDKHHLDAESKVRADKQAEWMKNNLRTNVVVEGHADPRGTREYNLALGQRRANAVRNHLIDQGIEPGRVSTVSYGKDNPPADAKTHAEKRVAVTKLQ